jgi:hypothetical protein
MTAAPAERARGFTSQPGIASGHDNVFACEVNTDNDIGSGRNGFKSRADRHLSCWHKNPPLINLIRIRSFQNIRSRIIFQHD